MGIFLSLFGMTSRPDVVAKALFGTSLTMADGILTAAVSVTSAVGGIGESLYKKFQGQDTQTPHPNSCRQA